MDIEPDGLHNQSPNPNNIHNLSELLSPPIAPQAKKRKAEETLTYDTPIDPKRQMLMEAIRKRKAPDSLEDSPIRKQQIIERQHPLHGDITEESKELPSERIKKVKPTDITDEDIEYFRRTWFGTRFFGPGNDIDINNRPTTFTHWAEEIAWDHDYDIIMAMNGPRDQFHRAVTEANRRMETRMRSKWRSLKHRTVTDSLYYGAWLAAHKTGLMGMYTHMLGVGLRQQKRKESKEQKK